MSGKRNVVTLMHYQVHVLLCFMAI